MKYVNCNYLLNAMPLFSINSLFYITLAHVLLNNCVFLPLRNISNKISCIVAGSPWDSTGTLQAYNIRAFMIVHLTQCIN